MDKKLNDKKENDLRAEGKIGSKPPGRNVTENEEIEQARIESRREADLDDKTPAGDAGVEDNPVENRDRETDSSNNY